ncbi:sensor histidine kinase [Carnobacterium inhibens]|uniref:histidine kinase n=1 Tax=Carnobacterium inhibens TaxID=147709 RepID=A0ABR7TFC7_9LACT|nr:HAMP domain-containing sensor histidine kinase [Carnobacterium inhibens]MBC9826177.1 HAMP domain-containing protein [Carnobacterium inhibens]
MNLTLRLRILLYLLLVSLSGILITSITIFSGVENQFTDYVTTNRVKSIQTIKKEVIQQYDDTGELTNEQLENTMHQQAMSESLYYKIYNNNDNLLIDSTSLGSMMKMMNGSQPSSNFDEYQSDSYQLKTGNQVIGNLTVYYSGQLIGDEFVFLKSIKRNIILAVLFTVILSILTSLLFSKRLTSGVNKLVTGVTELRNHQWKIPIPLKDLTGEMKPLGESFNQLADSLVKEETLRKQFTANFAHELRTPLATLRSQIEAFQDGIWKPDETRLEQFHAELMRLVRLVNDLEKLIAAENPQIKLNKTKLETGEILSFIEDQFISLFVEKGVSLEIQGKKESLWFYGDYDKIIQILINIVNNALQYTQPENKVSLCVEEKENYIIFIVKDEGEGISEEDLPLLFERFYRGDKSRDRKTGGVGIGLSIVKAFVEAHRGEIKIRSQLNVGTTVELHFPKK